MGATALPPSQAVPYDSLAAGQESLSTIDISCRAARGCGLNDRTLWADKVITVEHPRPAPLAAVAVLSLPALDAFCCGDGGDRERGDGVGPPPARERVGEQPDEQRNR